MLGDEDPADSSQNKSMNKKVFSMYVQLIQNRPDSYIASFVHLTNFAGLCDYYPLKRPIVP